MLLYLCADMLMFGSFITRGELPPTTEACAHSHVVFLVLKMVTVCQEAGFLSFECVAQLNIGYLSTLFFSPQGGREQYRRQVKG